MSPTIFRQAGYRFFFFSREENRLHVHVIGADGEAKYWLEPEVLLARNHRLSELQLAKIQQIVEDHRDELISAWNTHFED